jgi:hypothetical protein
MDLEGLEYCKYLWARRNIVMDDGGRANFLAVIFNGSNFLMSGPLPDLLTYASLKLAPFGHVLSSESKPLTLMSHDSIDGLR